MVQPDLDGAALSRGLLRLPARRFYFFALLFPFFSGGGDMWLNSFTGNSARKLGHAPRISPAYLTTCLALAATMAAVISGVFFASNVSSVSEWIDGHAPQVAIFLTEFPLATLLAVLGACFAGLFEAVLFWFAVVGSAAEKEYLF